MLKLKLFLLFCYFILFSLTIKGITINAIIDDNYLVVDSNIPIVSCYLQSKQNILEMARCPLGFCLKITTQNLKNEQQNILLIDNFKKLYIFPLQEWLKNKI